MKTAALLMLAIALSLHAQEEPGYDEVPGFPSDVWAAGNNYNCDTVEYKASDFGDRKDPLVDYSLCVSNKFGKVAEEVIRESFRTFGYYLQFDDVTKCLKDRVALSFIEDRDYPSTAIPPLQPKEVPLPDGKGVSMKTASVFVAALDSLEKTEGLISEGYSGRYKNLQFRKNAYAYVSIALSKELMASRSFMLGSDVDYWRGMIAIAYFKDVGVLTADERLPARAANVAACFRWNGRIPKRHLAYLPTVSSAKDRK